MNIRLRQKCLFFLVILVLFAGCQSRPAIQNPDLDHYHYGKFINLHKALYGYGYHQSELDEIEYLKPDEIEKKHYTFIHAYEPAKQIDRTKNCDPSVLQTKQIPNSDEMERLATKALRHKNKMIIIKLNLVPWCLGGPPQAD